jgi:hypothetical protein
MIVSLVNNAEQELLAIEGGRDTGYGAVRLLQARVWARLVEYDRGIRIAFQSLEM